MLRQETTRGTPRTTVGSSFALAYLLSAILIATLIWAGGLWNLLANSRILDLLMRSGIVAFTDADQGFYRGVPDAQYYVASQDPIDWGLLLLTAILLIVTYILRAVRLELIGTFVGATVARTGSIRAHLYGYSTGAFYPFGYGRFATAAELESRGSTPAAASRMLLVARFFSILEILVFAFVGIVTLAWSTALGQLVGPAVILALAYFLVRPARDEDTAGVFAGLGGTSSALAREPGFIVRGGALSGLALFLEVCAVYALSQAFSSTHVILNIDFPVVLMAIVAGHLASYIEVTPGGLGQFEWGMAIALYIGGLGMPEAMTLPIIYAIVRYALLAAVALVMRPGRTTDPDAVISRLAARTI